MFGTTTTGHEYIRLHKNMVPRFEDLYMAVSLDPSAKILWYISAVNLASNSLCSIVCYILSLYSNVLSEDTRRHFNLLLHLELLLLRACFPT